MTRRRRSDIGPLNSRWKGGKRINSHGYVEILHVRPGHHRAEHLMIAALVLGKPLPRGAVVHHIDCNRTNNAHQNLVILQFHKDHMELHRKLRVRRAGGDPWRDRLCSTCRLAKPATEFPRVQSTRDGLIFSSHCIDCGRDSARERMRVIRARRNAA